MNKSVLPNFLIVGAAKAGTTTLWAWLGQHPSIFLTPQKETHFLIYNCKQPRAEDVGPDSIRSADAYASLFRNVTSEKAVGEASPGYLCDPDVPGEINRYLPGAKAIMILRDPVDRAWSAFTKAVVLGHERDESDFLAALESEPIDNPDPWDGSRRYIRQGLYGVQTERYFRELGRERVKVLFYEDLQEDPRELLRNVFEFLEVDSDFLVDTGEPMNVTVKPRSRALHNFLTSPSSLRSWVEDVMPAAMFDRLRHSVRALRLKNLKDVPQLDSRTREIAHAYFRDDIQRLEKSVGRDLTGWRCR